MKKVIVGAVLLLVLAPLALAENTIKYQILSERKGFLGLSGKTTIMLDRETGDSWVLEEGKWVAVPRVENEKVVEEVSKARIAEAVKVLQDKQAQEINDLKAKQEMDIKALLEKQITPAKPVATADRPATTRWKRLGAARKIVKPERTTAADTGNQGEEGPPAWLTD